MTVFVYDVFFLVGDIRDEDKLSQGDTPERRGTSSKYGAFVVGVWASYVPQVEEEARYRLHITPGPLPCGNKGIPLISFGTEAEDKAGKDKSDEVRKDVLVVAGAAYKDAGQGVGSKAQLLRKAPSL